MSAFLGSTYLINTVNSHFNRLKYYENSNKFAPIHLTMCSYYHYLRKLKDRLRIYVKMGGFPLNIQCTEEG